jgi:UDP-2,3-diacylglucosamine hydrolase
VPRIGLIAGSGRLPHLFAAAAREQGLEVIAAAHRGETDPSLATEVEGLTWVRVGQVKKILRTFRDAGVSRAVMAGGIGRVRALTEARPDLAALKILSRLRTFRDDALLRAIARWFEEQGVQIASPTELLPRLLAPEGHLAGPALTEAQQKDVALGVEVALELGKVDVGQTVVVHNGHVLALEAVEGTDETLRRGARLGGGKGTVVKLCKPGQDARFDLPAIGPQTVEVMAEGGLSALAVEAKRTLLLDAPALLRAAERHRISVVGVTPPGPASAGVR